MKIGATVIRGLLEASGYYTALAAQVETQKTILLTHPQVKRNANFMAQVPESAAKSRFLAFLGGSVNVVQGKKEIEQNVLIAVITIVTAMLEKPESRTPLQETTNVIYRMFCEANRLDCDAKVKLSKEDPLEVEISDEDYATLTTNFN